MGGVVTRWIRNLVALLLLVGLATPGSVALAEPPPRQQARQQSERPVPIGKVEVRILAVRAGDGEPHVDPQLRSLVRHLAYLRHDRYELVTKTRGIVAPGGDELVFRVPDGPRVEVTLREIGGDRAKVRVRMFRGQDKVADTTVAIQNHGTFILTGPKYRGGILILPIRVDY